MQDLQKKIRPSANIRNRYNKILAEAEEDVNAGRVAPIEDTFARLRAVLKERCFTKTATDSTILQNET